MAEEMCWCGQPTGKAGKGEDSLYCEFCDAGPFCEECFEQHTCPTRAVNLKHEHCDVYIGRRGQWGNPYRIGIDGSREEVIAKYEKRIESQLHLLSQLRVD